MELIAPAGNLEKARYAYLYGADAVYMGIAGLSLRAHAEEPDITDLKELSRIKAGKKLYLAANIFFHNTEITRLSDTLPMLQDLPFDGFIVSDPGALRVLRSAFPNQEFHLSTQANCINAEAAKFYRDLGFKRIVLGRELTLEEIAEIARQVPDVELEVFVHGAMCLAYSGRCFLSAYMTNRSSNSGDCSHSCRWRYLLLEEESRPGERLPVVEGDGFTTILSSRDLCLIDHLDKIEAAGVHALKIEGRMKSVYYTAVVTRAYRKALDNLLNPPVPGLAQYIQELHNISHREYSSGFYFGPRDADSTTSREYIRKYRLMGLVLEEKAPGIWRVDIKNSFSAGSELEYLFPDKPCLRDDGYRILDENLMETGKARHGFTHYLETDRNLGPGCIIRAVTDKRITDAADPGPLPDSGN